MVKKLQEPAFVCKRIRSCEDLEPETGGSPAADNPELGDFLTRVTGTVAALWLVMDRYAQGPYPPEVPAKVFFSYFLDVAEALLAECRVLEARLETEVEVE